MYDSTILTKPMYLCIIPIFVRFINVWIINMWFEVGTRVLLKKIRNFKLSPYTPIYSRSPEEITGEMIFCLSQLQLRRRLQPSS